MAANTILILIGILCVVNASIISINIYDGEKKLSDSQTLKDCDNIGCDQTCRRIGFPGGICVGDRCKCDILRNALEGEIDLPRSETIKDCDNNGCDQTCRRIGFPGGVCVGDRCKCDIMKNELEEVSETNVPNIRIPQTPVKDCNYQACYELCRSMGFPGGACLGDYCQCNPKSRRALLNMLIKCDIVKCDDMCHRLNYAGGTCRGDSCECY
ncbi:hypothetical protein K1T71_004891 [Dendrolimus kikuchii]|uniref:Uncharacterized protein n=1 Tax=Dendrolimus kikuchii TaxID=765133 RepID=A0ACC1D5E9_9NEOP|nr:hypothetical protein K1T71_004891 [Dendrolimus kikuchii]